MSKNVNVNRIVKNTGMLYIRTILIMLVSLYTSRVVLKTLGVEDFGTYNVVAGAVAFFSFLNNAMSMATQRFLAVEMVKEDASNLRRVFSMAMNIHIIIAAIVVILSETIGLWLVNSVLNIPEDRMVAANWVFQFVVVNMFFSIITVPYNSAIIAHERMNVYAYIGILDVFLKLGMTILLRVFHHDKLIVYGLLMMGITILVFFIYKLYSNSKFRESKFLILWDKPLFKEMSGFLGWNICGQLAQIFTTQGVNMVVNVFYGVVLNAAMSIQNQVTSAITMFVQNFQVSFRPQIMKSFAAHEMTEMKQLTQKASKMSFFLLYLIAIPILFNIDLILKVWLDTVPEYTGIFCRLVIWFSYLEALGLPLVMTIMASGKNRNYQIFVSITISLNLLLVWLFLKWGYPPEYIFYIKIIIATFTLAVRLFFARKQSGISVFGYFKSVIIPCLIVLAITQPIILLFTHMYGNGNIMWKLSLTVIIEIISATVIFLMGMNRTERSFCKSFFYKIIKMKV